MTTRRAVAGLLSLIVGLPSPASAAGENDVAPSKPSVEQLAQNRAQPRRPAAPAAKSDSAPNTTPADPARKGDVAQAPRRDNLEQRVKDLEDALKAQEDATRSIVRSALSGLGPKINEFVALSGALEVLVGRTREFTGPSSDSLSLNTAEIDLDIKANDWTTGSLIIAWDAGTSPLFPTTDGFSRGVDRFTVDRATINLGDWQAFPLYAKGGRDVLPFGTSTGIARADQISITNPLTTEVFETRQNFIGAGFALPTPPLTRPPPPVVIPPVRPQVINPLVTSGIRALGYEYPPTRPPPPTPVTPPPVPPPFYGNVYFFDGNSQLGSNRSIKDNINASLGYRTEGHCGRPYDRLRATDFCPWSFDVHVDYISSVFDSTFLESGYEGFLGQIGSIRGAAVSVKATLGPVALTGEVNSAIETARFFDGAGRQRSLSPAAWQVSLGYQFGWNPWVEKVGDQGNFLALTYSESRDLAGVFGVDGATRVGFAPRSRASATVGEWVLDGLKLSLEYSRAWDYSIGEGGTGNSAHAVLGIISYQF